MEPQKGTMTNLVITAFCACHLCCGKWSGGPTASGVMPKAGVTAAANAFPFGTRLRIEGVGERVVQDRMARRYSNRVDVFFATHEQAKRFGIRTNLVEVVKP